MAKEYKEKRKRVFYATENKRRAKPSGHLALAAERAGKRRGIRR